MGLSPQLNVIVGANTDQLRAEMARAQSTIKGFVKTINTATNVLGGFGAGFTAVRIGQWVADAVGDMAEFSHSMSEVKAITGATGKDLAELRENAIDLAGAFKAIDISKLETEFGRLGFSTKEILASTEATINLATATGSNLANSAVIAGSTLRAFQLDAKEMGRVTDVMAGALNRSGLDMANFAEAIKYVAPNAKAANISLEETAAMLGVLADSGIKGSLAGTALRRIITDLSTESKPLSERLQELSARGLNAADAMEEIGRIGATSLLVLSNNAESVNSLTGELHNVTGEAREMAKVMQDDLIGDWNKFNAELFRTVQQGGPVESFLRGAVQWMTKYVEVANTADVEKLKLLFGINTHHPDSREHGATGDWDTGGATGSWDKELTPEEKYKAALTGVDRSSRKGMAGTPDLSDIFKMGNGQTNILGDTAAGLKNVAKDANYVSDAYKEMYGEVDQANDAFELMHEEVAPDVTAAVDVLIQNNNRLKASTIDVKSTMAQMGRQVKTVFVDVASDIGTALGNLASGVNTNLAGTLLGTLGSIAVQVGKMAIGIGIAMLGIKLSLKTLNPVAAIAAGIALVALGTIFTNQSQSIASSMGGGGSGSGGSNYARPGDTMSVQPLTINLGGTVHVVQRGRDLVGTIDVAKSQQTRTGGGKRGN